MDYAIAGAAAASVATGIYSVLDSATNASNAGRGDIANHTIDPPTNNLDDFKVIPGVTTADRTSDLFEFAKVYQGEYGKPLSPEFAMFIGRQQSMHKQRDTVLATVGSIGMAVPAPTINDILHNLQSNAASHKQLLSEEGHPVPDSDPVLHSVRCHLIGLAHL